MFQTHALSRWAALSLVALALARPAPSGAQPAPVKLAAGVYGVYGFPIIQEDADPGPLYGAKVKALLVGPLGAELFFTSFREGDVTFQAGGVENSIEGGTQNAFGANLILGGPGAAGFGLYLTGGIGSYSISKDGRPDVTEMGWNGGLGFEFRSATGLAVDVSGRLHAVILDDGGSRKFAGIQAGINYYFLR
jgi:hypothetical protein